MTRGTSQTLLRVTISVGFALLGLLGSANPAAGSPRVLLLNSYHPQYEWTERLVAGVRDELADVVASEDLHIEYMDNRRMLDGAPYLEHLAALYEHKYAARPPDLVLSSDDSALNFLRLRRRELFPGVPIIFCGVNAVSPEDIEPLENATGILEGLEVEDNLALIQQLHPDVERVVVLSDSTSLGRSMTEQARPALAAYASRRLRAEIWDDFAFEELLTRVGTLGARDVILLLAIHKDREGRYFSFDTDLPVLSQRASRPIYGLFGMLTGKGVVGGAQNAPYEHGRHAAALARRVLQGESPSNIPISVERYAPRFDYRQLQRFGLSEDKLPEGSTVLFRPRSIFRDYPWEIGIVATLLSLLTLVSVVLAFALRRQRRAEQALRDSEARLLESQKLETLGRLSGGIAHDFNNLLMPILGFSELLKAEMQDPTVEAHVTEIQRAAESAAQLVRQLLTFSRRGPMQTQVVDLAELVRSHTALLRRTIREGIELSVAVGDGPCRIIGQRSQLEQVLMNLVVNAGDAIEGRGRVAIVTRTIEVGTRSGQKLGLEPGRYAVLTVDDDGPGIPANVIAKVFEPFFTTKAHDAGTGLGLATVYGIARRHGGTALAHNRRPRGARFEVYLPATDVAVIPKPPLEEPSQARPAMQATVLVAEDSADVRRLVVQTLEREGFTVYAASDGESALQLCAGIPELHLLLTDVVMPGMNGMELSRRVALRCPHVPTLFMTAYDPRSEGSEPLPNCLSKPFTPSLLVRTVTEALHARAESTGKLGTS